MNKTSIVKLFSVAVLSVLALIGLGVSPVGAGNSSFVPTIDTSNRAEVAATYRSAVASNLDLAAGWNGSAAECRPGSATDTYDAATVESINWFRRMSGLGVVAEDPAASARAQQTALMMHAQGNLSHYPTPAWRCHSATGASIAAESNLTLGVVGPRGVLGQIEDPGAGNEALGHRRWLLFPQLKEVGVANTSRASVIRVLGEFGPRVTRSNWVAWPPSGFVPDETVFERWSLSFAGSASVNFSQARVRVFENGQAKSVQMLPLSNGFGDPTLGWEVDGIRPDAPGDVVYRVEVSNIDVGGKVINHNYSFTSFDPFSIPMVSTGAAADPILCLGRVATIVGTAGNDTLRGTAGPDVIVGLGGDDTIDGLAGNDIICGGGGDDLIRAGWGNDVVLGGNGSDVIRGGPGNDALYGQNGRDKLYGGHGADTLVGGNHLDTLVGGPGNDICWGRVVNQAANSIDVRVCERGR